MRLLQRRRQPRAKTIRPAEPYLVRGADEARRLGHPFVGTEHVLLALVRHPEGGTQSLLRPLSPDAIEESLPSMARGAGSIDPEALAALGIDFDAVRERVEQAFGPGALEQTRSGCLGVAPRLKRALAYAVDQAGGGPIRDEHVLLGFLSVPDSLAARFLDEHGVTLAMVRALSRPGS